MHVTVARQLYIAKDKADKEAALERQARNNERMAAVSRWPDSKGGSHILDYADNAGGTTENAMFGTPDEICETLEALRKAGAEYHHFRDGGRPRAPAPLCPRHHAGLFQAARGRRKCGAERADARLSRAVPGFIAPCHRRNPLRR